MRQPAASKDTTIAAYRAHADLFESRNSQKDVRRTPPFLALILARLPKHARILDLGCGSGHDALIFLKAGHRVDGVDALDIFVDRARARTARFKSRARFRVGDLLTFPLANATYDLVWANASLIHAPKRDLKNVLVRLRHALKPDGVLAATIHNGRKEGVSPRTWIPGRFFASYLKDELARYVKPSKLIVESLNGVVNRDRKGRWLNLVARASGLSGSNPIHGI